MRERERNSNSYFTLLVRYKADATWIERAGSLKMRDCVNERDDWLEETSKAIAGINRATHTRIIKTTPNRSAVNNEIDRINATI